MPRILQRTAVALFFGTALAGCSSFLDADKATRDPNLPSAATRDQLFVGAQANIFAQQEGPLAMIVCQWMQQCSGINGRFVQQQDNYLGVNPGTFDLPFQEVYSAGGLLSLRSIQASASAEGDKVYEGIAQVLEALLIGTTADIWGSIPYSEAVADNATPAFDDQMAVYTAVQTLLDQAITNIDGAGAGPGGVDLFFGDSPLADQRTKWKAVARTLKARFHLHTAERLGGTAAYTAARTAALQGISAAENDLRTLHSGVTSERNMWVQFQNTSGFGLDLVAGKRLVDIMLAQNDPRLPEYFGLNEQGGYGGMDVTTQGGTPGPQISPLAGSERHTDDFRQPIVTWEENQLIIAEASLALGDLPTAQTALNAVRAAHGKPVVVATLQSVMEEKYISMFQNLEVWNDWKRTCLPALTPAFGRPGIPRRLFYGQTEEQTNPNTPSSADQNMFTIPNPNDPNACP
jgi:hypothetical protein